MNLNQISLKNSAAPELGRIKLNPSLEDILSEMASYGEPRVSLQSNGWYCACDIYVNTEGATFKIASDFSHKSPLSSAEQCMDRIKNSMKMLKL